MTNKESEREEEGGRGREMYGLQMMAVVRGTRIAWHR